MKRGESGINLLLAVNKPEGMSSHDVVNVVRRSVGERRVGHAGTLDPAATGVLVIGIGQGTRLMGLLTADQKSYVATIRFGFETSTDDAEGDVTRTAALPEWLGQQERARGVLESFVGEQEQVPPAYSAISVNGKRAYARARSGETVTLEARPITVYSAELLSIENDDAGAPMWNCAFCVSKGTYIRALARDLGSAVGSAAHLCRLCRTASGLVTLRECITLADLEQGGAAYAREHAIDPVRALGLPSRELTSKELQRVQHGGRLGMQEGTLVVGDQLALTSGSRLMGIWKAANGYLAPTVNFPQGIEGIRS